MEARYGMGAVFDGFGLSVSSTALNRVFSAARGADEPVAQGAADFASFRNLGAIVYSRTATVMATMARVYGEERVARALGDYTRRFRFRHPGPSDFMAVMQEELGADAANALSTALFARGTVDYLVREISNAPEPSVAGVFDGPEGRQKKKPDAPETNKAAKIDAMIAPRTSRESIASRRGCEHTAHCRYIPPKVSARPVRT